MLKKLKSKIFTNIVISLVLIMGVFAVGVYIGYKNSPAVEKVLSLRNKTSMDNIDADFNPFWKVWNTINSKSIYANKASNQDRVWGAAEGLASSLGDPYTVFFPPKDNKSFHEEISGSFSGIGAEIGIKEKILTVIAPLKDTPAWKAGLKTGDKIVKIDKKTTNNMSIDKAINLIRGKKGTIVILTIFREGESRTRDISITRDNIQVPALESKMLDDNIFMISFYTFSQNSARLFRVAADEFLNSGSHKLIIDLRGNPGGYLGSAVDIGSLFIDQGKVIVSEDFGGKEKANVYRSHGPKLFGKDYSVVVLVNGGSASASEILSGALKQQGVATLVGEQTFGKGSVQELINITNNTSLKVTVAHWLTPNGTSISEKGLTPDVVVPFTLKDFKNHIDPQLAKAVEILKKK